MNPKLLFLCWNWQEEMKKGLPLPLHERGRGAFEREEGRRVSTTIFQEMPFPSRRSREIKKSRISEKGTSSKSE